VAAVGIPTRWNFSTWLRDRGQAEAAGRGLGRRADVATRQSRPDIRSVRPGRAAGGSGALGCGATGYTVARINQLPLLPGILVALAFLMAIGVLGGARGDSGAVGFSRET